MMMRFLFFLSLSSYLSTILPTLVVGAKYDGIYFLAEGIDEVGDVVTIPRENSGENNGNHHPFLLDLRSETSTKYAISLRLGNTLRSKMVITPNTRGGEEDTVHINEIVSTRMMPPENIFRVEQFLMSNLPKMTTIHIEEENKNDNEEEDDDDDQQKLILQGQGKTKIVFVKE